MFKYWLSCVTMKGQSGMKCSQLALFFSTPLHSQSLLFSFLAFAVPSYLVAALKQLQVASLPQWEPLGATELSALGVQLVERLRGSSSTMEVFPHLWYRKALMHFVFLTAKQYQPADTWMTGAAPQHPYRALQKRRECWCFLDVLPFSCFVG